MKLADGIEHRDDVRDGRAGLDVVNRIEHKAAARRENLAAAPHLIPHFGRVPKGSTCWVSTRAPDHNSDPHSCA